MVTYRAIATGNWSNLAIWTDNSTGSFIASTVLPGTDDRVESNGFIVEIDQDISVLSLRRLGLDGRFEVNSKNVIITTTEGIYGRTSVNATAINNASFGLIIFGNSNVIINSDIFAGAANFRIGLGVQMTDGTLVINGNIYGTTTSGTSNAAGMATYGTAPVNPVTITINGIIQAGTLALSHGLILSSGNYITNVNGTVLGSNSTGNGILMQTAASTLNIVGNVTAGSIAGGNGVDIAVNGCVVHILGTISASSVSVGFNPATNTGTFVVSSPIINFNSVLGVTSTTLRFFNGLPVIWEFFDNTDQPKILYSEDNVPNYPIVGDVREGVMYGAGGGLEGELIVPDPSLVRKGVPTDNTVGTADLTAQDFLDALTNSPDDIAVRLRNVATVQSTGDQIQNLT
jgi:hypothetical protein